MARYTTAGYTAPGRGGDFGGLLCGLGDTAIDPADGTAAGQRIRARHNRHGCQPSQGHCPDPAAHQADVEDMTPVLQALGLASYEPGGRLDPYGKRRRD